MKFSTILLATAVGSSHAFAPGVKTNTAWGRTSLQMGKIIDDGNVGKKESTFKAFSGRAVPGELGVTKSYDLDLPADIGSQKIFELEAGAKVESHSHPASGQYFVAEGNISVKTSEEESKEYTVGNMFIIPAETEYTLEANDGPGVMYYVWCAERDPRY